MSGSALDLVPPLCHEGPRVARLLEHPFTVREAVAAGVSEKTVRRLRTEGLVDHPLRGVYVSRRLTLTPELRAACVAKVAKPHVVITDKAAAWLWGIDAYAPSERSGPLAVDAFSLRTHTRVRRDGVHSGQRDLRSRDWVEVHGVKVTTPLRTALDLACRLSRYEGLAALDALMRAHGLTHLDLYSELLRFRGRRGVVQARELALLSNALSESAGESFTRLAIHDDGLPAPALQVWVLDDNGVRRYRLDLAYEQAMVAIEYDGEEHHSSAIARLRDAERRTWLRARGWTIIVVRKGDFKEVTRTAWLREVRSALRAR